MPKLKEKLGTLFKSKIIYFSFQNCILYVSLCFVIRAGAGQDCTGSGQDWTGSTALHSILIFAFPLRIFIRFFDGR